MQTNLPQDKTAENILLCSILLDNSILAQVIGVVKTEHFYSTENQIIYTAVVNLESSSQPIDITHLVQYLNTQGTLENAGGIAYITKILDYTPSAKGWEEQAHIIVEKSKQRQLCRLASVVVKSITGGQTTATAVMNMIQDTISKIEESNPAQEVDPYATATATMEEIQALVNGGSAGLQTCFNSVNKYTGGLRNGNLVIIGARPSMGKTTLALNIAMDLGIKQNIPVAFFSLEMSRSELCKKCFSVLANIENSKITTGALTQQEVEKLNNAVSVFGAGKLFIVDTGTATITDIVNTTKRLKRQKDIKAVFIDYLQLISGTENKNRVLEISQISRKLKLLARELDIPVICLSQLSRSPEQRQDKRPMLSDLRESGAIEQDADAVLFLYREVYYNPETENKKITELRIAKNRNGKTGTILLDFYANNCLFLESAMNKIGTPVKTNVKTFTDMK